MFPRLGWLSVAYSLMTTSLDAWQRIDYQCYVKVTIITCRDTLEIPDKQ